MLLPVETGGKKHIIAERCLEPSVPNNLCNLFVSNVEQFLVYTLYSALTKKIVAYKVFNNTSELNDSWSDFAQFNQVYFCDENTKFTLIPKSFSVSSADNDFDFVLEYFRPDNHIHIFEGFSHYVAKYLTENTVFAYVKDDHVAIALYENSKCVFANAFIYSDQVEILYFIIGAIKVSNFHQNDTNIILDPSLFNLLGFSDFIQTYFKSVKNLSIPFENPDDEMPDLSHLLMANHLISLCV